jgi:hypothetical protein
MPTLIVSVLGFIWGRVKEGSSAASAGVSLLAIAELYQGDWVTGALATVFAVVGFMLPEKTQKALDVSGVRGK